MSQAGSRALTVAALVALVSIGIVSCTFSSVYEPLSPPAEIGVPVEGTFFTECGLHQTVFDLDGSLWAPVDLDPADRRPPDGVRSPTDTGSLTLLAPNRAQYRSSMGRVFELQRREAELRVSDC